MRTFAILLVAVAALAAASCNTIAGAGRDLEAAGEAVTGTSRDVAR